MEYAEARASQQKVYRVEVVNDAGKATPVFVPAHRNEYAMKLARQIVNAPSDALAQITAMEDHPHPKGESMAEWIRGYAYTYPFVCPVCCASFYDDGSGGADIDCCGVPVTINGAPPFAYWTDARGSGGNGPFRKGTPNAEVYARAMSYIVRFGDHATRAPMLLNMLPRVNERVWIALAGSLWDGLDAAWQNMRAITRVLRNTTLTPASLRRHFMSLESQREWNALPPLLNIYRGCYANSRDGASWSLDSHIAARFPLNPRYQQERTPLLLNALGVPKADVLYVADRGEKEVILLRPVNVSAAGVSQFVDGTWQ